MDLDGKKELSFGSKLDKFTFNSPNRKSSSITKIKTTTTTTTPKKVNNKLKRSSSPPPSSPTSSSILPSSPPKKKKKIRGYAEPSKYSHLNPLTDNLETNLNLIFCGINPGIQSALLGQHYANPTNHYYKCLNSILPTTSSSTSSSSSTGEEHVMITPSNSNLLLPTLYKIGNTNLISRPTAEQNELSKKEMLDSVPLFLHKILLFKPRMVVFVGMGICEIVVKWLKDLPSSIATTTTSTTSTTSTLFNNIETKTSSTKSKKSKSSSSTSPTKSKLNSKIKIGLQKFVISFPSSSPSSTFITSTTTPTSTSTPNYFSNDLIKKEEEEETEEKRNLIHFYAVSSTSARVVAYQLKDKLNQWKVMNETLQKILAEPEVSSVDLEEEAGEEEEGEETIIFRAEELSEFINQGLMKEEEEEVEEEL